MNADELERLVLAQVAYINKANALVRVQCAHAECGHAVGIVYRTAAGSMYEGQDRFGEWAGPRPNSREAVWDVDFWAATQYEEVDDAETEHRRRFSSPRGTVNIFDFPLRADVEHPTAAGWCPNHQRVYFEWDAVIAALNPPPRRGRPRLVPAR